MEAIRAQRLLIAFLNDDGEEVGKIATEVRQCQDCMGRLLAHYLGANAEMLSQISGSREGAAMAAEMALTDLKRGLL
ncbi:hypothetical protein ABQF26_01685 [Mycolicibacterium elephantis]